MWYSQIRRSGRLQIPLILGGGYGPLTPSEEIAKIAEESKRLNYQLGKKWISIGELKEMVREAAKYLDEVTGIKDSPEGGIVDKLIDSAADGRIDIKRLLDDLENSLDI